METGETGETGETEPGDEEENNGEETIEVGDGDHAILEDIEKELSLQLTPEELRELFEKNTASFRCLAQVLVSRSSILHHPLYHFPPLTDPGIDEAFDYKEPEVIYDDIGCDVYRTMCKEYVIVPISRVLKALPTRVLDLKYYGLTLKQIKSISETLKLNMHVKELILEENAMNPDAMYHIGDMLRENNCLTYLNLKNCVIGPVGCGKLSEGIFSTQCLRELDLSSNEIRSEGIATICSSIRENLSIKKLNLSRNLITEDVCMKLGAALAENACLEDLDLSWNQLYTINALKHLCEGLTLNTTIKVLNLAWNGISRKEAFVHIIKYMKATTILEHLNVSNNQLSGICWKMVISGIVNNTSLISMNIGYNTITPEEALAVANVFTATTEEPLKLTHLDLSNVYVSRKFLPYWRKVTKLGKSIIIEGVLSNYRIKGPDTKKLIFDRIRYIAQKPKKKKARREFGHFLHSLKEESMTKGPFMLALKKFKCRKIYKDEDLLKELLKKFSPKKDKIEAFVMRDAYYNYYPDTTIPEPKKKKKKGKKKKSALAIPSVPNESLNEVNKRQSKVTMPEISPSKQITIQEPEI